MVCFRRKNQVINDLMTVTMDGIQVGREKSATFLGMTLDENLSWEYRCNNVANKMARNAGILNRVKKTLPISSMCTLYNSLIFPHFTYGLEAWGTCQQKYMKRITKIQKKSVRSISKSHWLSHTEPRMKKFNILKVNDQHQLQCMSLAYDMLKGTSPDIFNLSRNQNAQRQLPSLRSTTERPEDLRIPIPSTTPAQKSFITYISQPWNALPSEIKNASSRKNFKTQLKKILINQYDSKVECSNRSCTDQKYHQTLN